VRHRALTLALLVAALAGGLLAAGCRGGGGDPDADAADVLKRGAERMDRVKSFHFDLTHENGTSQIVRNLQMVSATGDVVPPDRLRLDAKAKAGPLNIAVGIIAIPGASYITNPLTGRWEQEQISVAQFFDPATGVTALMRAATSPSITGTEKVEGRNAYRIEATIDSGRLALFGAGAAPGRAMKARAWIGVDDPVLVRVEIEGAVAEGEPANLVRRLTLSKWDEPVQISAPQ
jgi:hypothetical protein